MHSQVHPAGNRFTPLPSPGSPAASTNMVTQSMDRFIGWVQGRSGLSGEPPFLNRSTLPVDRGHGPDQQRCQEGFKAELNGPDPEAVQGLIRHPRNRLRLQV